jgi:hypothetical protein
MRTTMKRMTKRRMKRRRICRHTAHGTQDTPNFRHNCNDTLKEKNKKIIRSLILYRHMHEFLSKIQTIM